MELRARTLANQAIEAGHGWVQRLGPPPAAPARRDAGCARSRRSPPTGIAGTSPATALSASWAIRAVSNRRVSANVHWPPRLGHGHQQCRTGAAAQSQPRGGSRGAKRSRTMSKRIKSRRYALERRQSRQLDFELRPPVLVTSAEAHDGPSLQAVLGSPLNWEDGEFNPLSSALVAQTCQPHTAE